jgi:hypothetical protein
MTWGPVPDISDVTLAGTRKALSRGSRLDLDALRPCKVSKGTHRAPVIQSKRLPAGTMPKNTDVT